MSVATTVRSRRSTHLRDEQKSIETQTTLTYSGDYLHGRPVLVKMESVDNFFSSATAIFFGIGMVISLLMGTCSYFLSWRLRDPALLVYRNQRLFATAYPFVLSLGMFVSYGVSMPCLVMVASGYLEPTRHDLFFMIAIVCYSVFFGIPAIIIESDWLLPLDKDEVGLYRYEDLTVSRVALAINFFISGGSIWWIYLTYLSRRLNEAVENRAKLWHEYRRGLQGKRVCFAARVAVGTADEVEVREGDPEDPWHEKVKAAEDAEEEEMREKQAAAAAAAAAGGVMSPSGNDGGAPGARSAAAADAAADDVAAANAAADALGESQESADELVGFNPVRRKHGAVPWGRSDPRSPIQD